MVKGKTKMKISNNDIILTAGLTTLFIGFWTTFTFGFAAIILGIIITVIAIGRAMAASFNDF